MQIIWWHLSIKVRTTFRQDRPIIHYWKLPFRVQLKVLSRSNVIKQISSLNCSSSPRVVIRSERERQTGVAYIQRKRVDTVPAELEIFINLFRLLKQRSPQTGTDCCLDTDCLMIADVRSYLPPFTSLCFSFNDIKNIINYIASYSDW